MLIFKEDVRYSPVEDTWMEEDEWIAAGFNVEDGYLVFPAGTEFKVIEEIGEGGYPVLEINGEQFDFAGDDIACTLVLE